MHFCITFQFKQLFSQKLHFYACHNSRSIVQFVTECVLGKMNCVKKCVLLCRMGVYVITRLIMSCNQYYFLVVINSITQLLLLLTCDLFIIYSYLLIKPFHFLSHSSSFNRHNSFFCSTQNPVSNVVHFAAYPNILIRIL